MNIFNTAKFLQGGDKKDGEEPMLCLWQGKDVVNKSECLCVRWSGDGNHVAAGGGDGAVRIYDSKNNGQLLKYLGEPARDNQKIGAVSLAPEENPVMAMRWHPKQAGRIRVAKSNGTIELYDVKTKSTRSTTKEVDKDNNNKSNQTIAIDYNSSGDTWCSGGSDRIVRVYDEAVATPKLEMRGSLAGNRGHSNRICSVRFWPFNRNVIVSGGLDGTVMGWDTTAEMKNDEGEPICLGEPFRTISDLDVRGDSLDFDDNHLIVGSWRPVAQLQLFDMRTGKLEKSIGWRKPRTEAFPVNSQAKSRWAKVADAVKGSCNVYASQYIASGPHRGSIAAGGTGNQELKFFKKSGEDPDHPEFTPTAKIDIPSGVQGIHVSPNGMCCAVAAINGSVFNVKLPDKVAAKKP
jgi:WD40 repeat protein